ncbi:beta-galactosidase [Episyrphus balteatus]|uniref:beta-galactosidase n=1 Tax=Episyrphus balteatus TaxID=286459 RepID=UPI002485BAC6|nr:beta-galactosidase [Episyrphus balteatus]XP_055849557.1 beta-galactosidase [Episyrphus balteatus]XP_055849558.1 beta-galactosidase [Episyrphus balteatus]XP_055849559.1 beta-galactosidase [Episyrphus balteatus]
MLRTTCSVALLCLFVLLSLSTTSLARGNRQVIDASNGLDLHDRTFTVDWEGNRFLKDGKPFRFIAGSFHYFRSHPGSWQRKLRSMRAAGLNAVTTYVEWSLHNPKDGQYVWDGIADLEKFIKLAIAEDLLVILRPGPYICAERDMGGFPYWLLTKYPQIQLRTADINYLYEVRLWYAQLMARMGPYLYGNGGPIIMVQVENEYGSFYACDKKYREWMRDETHAHVKDKAVLFTNDGPSVLGCGYIPGVLATLDFGATDNTTEQWAYKKKLQPKGPLVNAEYYPGWLTHWQEKMSRVQTKSVTPTFIKMLDEGASVNFYMFYGGTNFGFTAGANDGGPGRYQPDTTSYDYDAPMDESGDPTEKYYKLREIIGRYETLPDIPLPVPLPKKHYGTIRLTGCCHILSNDGRRILSAGTVTSQKPQTFEALDQYSGLVLYETSLPSMGRDPFVLRVDGIRDRGYVYVDRNFIGVLSRESQVFSLPINAGLGNKLQILVENQGRINYNIPNDFKGILNDVIVDRTVLKNWTMTKYPLESYNDIVRLIETEGMPKTRGFRIHNNRSMLRSGPAIFYGELEIEEEEVYDTYIDPRGWSKGIVFVNGENLGRYWPTVGPQITLYVPKEVLKTGTNHIVMIEYLNAPESGEVTFTDVPNLDG